MSKRILSLVLALAMLFTMSINVLASPAFTFFSMVSPTEAMVGKTVTVQIKAEPQTDLSKMNVRMPFDPDILEYAFHEVTYDFPGLVDVNVGENYITLNQTGSTPYYLENTTFLKVTFNVLAPYENYEFTLDLENCFTMACEPNGNGTYYEYELEPRMNEDFGGPSYTTFKAACVEHDFVLQSGEPSCTAGGYSYERCSNCDESRNYTSIPALGHSCEDGYCVRCGEREGVWVSGSHNDHLWELLGDGGFGGTLVIKPEEGLTDVEIEDNDDVFLIWHDWNLGSCSNATSIVIEEGISRIGAIAFHNMDNVETVELPSTLTSIGRDAFKDCTELSTVIYNGEEEDWANIEIAEGNDKLIKIVENGGSGDSGSKYGFIGENATWELNEYGVLIIIGSGELALERGQYEVPWSEYIDEIQRISFGGNITSISDNLFRRHMNVSSVGLPESLESIGRRAFYMCNNVTEIYIPSNIQEIGSDAFAGCRLKTYDISPENKWFTSRDGVLFDKELRKLIAYPQMKQDKSYTIPSTVNEIFPGAFKYGRAEEVIIPDSVNSIGTEAFFNNNKLTEIHIPESVESMGDCVFSRCMSLESITVDSDNENYCAVDGVLFDKEMKTLIHYPACKEDAEYTVPDSVYHIGAESFANNEFLETVNLSEALESIGIAAFDCCRNLSTVNFPANMTQFSTIGEAAFAECPNLADVYFHGSEEEWGAIVIDEENDYLLNAEIHFVGDDEENEVIDSGVCGAGLTWQLTKGGVLTVSGEGKMTSTPWSSHKKEITAVIIEDGVTNITEAAFKDCYNMKSAEIGADVEVIGAKAFYECESLTEITIPAKVVSISDNTFTWCEKLETVTLPEGLETIGENAFKGCYALKNMEIPSSVTSFSKGAFADCRSLESIIIPEEMTEIPEALFENCRSLNNVVIPNNVTSIGKAAFNGCHKLDNITLPEGLETIGEWAFSCCNALEEITIPASVKEISRGAFNDCSELAYVYFGGSKMDWKKLSVGEYNDAFTDAIIHFDVVAELPAGDANGDTKIDSADVNFLYRAIMDYTELTEAQAAAADVNDDGKVNSADVNLLYRYVMGYVDAI